MSLRLRAKGSGTNHIFFLCLAVSFLVLPFQAHAENLLLNPSFEEPGVPGELPTHWINEGFDWCAGVLWTVYPFEGNWMLTNGDIDTAARHTVCQVVTVDPARLYNARCFFAALYTLDVGVYARVGLDPTGAEDPRAPSVQWGSDISLPPDGAWVSAAMEAVAAIGNTMTVFCEGETTGALVPGGLNFAHLCVDAALLEPYQGTPTPTPTVTLTYTPEPTNTPTPSLPPTNTPTPQPGIAGFALDLDGNDYCRAADHPALELTDNNALTLEAWVYRRPEGNYWQVALSKGNTDPYGLTVTGDGFLHFEVSSRSLNTPPTSVPFNTWTHIAGTWDGNTMRAYVNGVELASRPTSWPLSTHDLPFLIGAAHPPEGPYEFWHGVIDEVRVWNVARSAGEIRDSSAVALIGDEAGLVAYWSFDEGTGQWAYDQGVNNISLQLGAVEVPDDYDPAWVGSDLPDFTSPAGQIRFGSEAYPCTAVIGITLGDTDLVDDATWAVELSSSGGDLETVVLVETHVGWPTFEGSVPVAAGSPVVEDGTLEVSHGETVTGTYRDADDGSGNPAVAVITAEIDCVPPLITNVAVTDTMPDWATVAIETTEPTTAFIRYGTSCSMLDLVAFAGIPAGLHLTSLEELTPQTEYFFLVEVRDAAGNETIDDNEGLCYSFETVPRSFAWEFSGNQYAEADRNPALDLAENNQFTLEAWVSRRPGERYWQVVLGKSDTSPYGLTVPGDEFLHFELVTDSGGKILNTPPRSVRFNIWTHIAGTWDGSLMRAYVNGIESASREALGTIPSSDKPFLVGAAATEGDEGWYGVIDEVRVWNVARTESEIQASMWDSLTGNETGFVAGWKLNEGTRDYAYDQSPNRIRLRRGAVEGPDGRDPLWVPAFRVDLDPRIEPSIPKTTDDLECIVTGAPPAEIGDLDLSYLWIRDGEIIVEPLELNGDIFFPTESVLSHHFTTKNETYFCVVTTTNEVPYSRTYTAAVEIINSTPTAPVVRIDPQNPQASDGLMVSVTHPSTDPDGDDFAYAVRWYRSQDGGETFERIPELTWITVPPGLLTEGEVWRVEIIPIDLGNAGSEGEAGWDQVYVGINARPTVTITRPGPENVIAAPLVTIAWEAEDIDGDAVAVDLYYDTDNIEGGALPIAMAQPASGSMTWVPPGAAEAVAAVDLSEDGVVNAEDLFILASRWHHLPEKARYRIFARAWDEKGAIGEAFSSAEIIVPEGLPANLEGLLQVFREWSEP